MDINRSWVAIIDDEETVCRSLVRLLRSSGISAQSYTSGIDFISTVGKNLPSCVLIDINMPVINGLEFCTWLTDSDYEIPIIFMTGYDLAETREKAFAMQPVAYLIKPMDANLLLDAVATALRTGLSAGSKNQLTFE